jgi:hypothetical protein
MRIRTSRSNGARELNWNQQKLDPDEDGDWDTYDEQDKAFFRDCVRC